MDFGKCQSCDSSLKTPFIKCESCSRLGFEVYVCPTCFSKGQEFSQHKNDHPYSIVRMDFHLFEPSWTAEEEMLLLNALNDHGKEKSSFNLKHWHCRDRFNFKIVIRLWQLGRHINDGTRQVLRSVQKPLWKGLHEQQEPSFGNIISNNYCLHFSTLHFHYREMQNFFLKYPLIANRIITFKTRLLDTKMLIPLMFLGTML